MQTMTAGYRSLSLLIELNWDRLFYIGAIAVALIGGSAIGSALTDVVVPQGFH